MIESPIERIPRRARRDTPKAVDLPPREPAQKLRFGDQEVAYHAEAFPGDEVFFPGEVVFAKLGKGREAAAWEYVGRTGSTPAQAVFVRYDEKSKNTIAEIFLAHHRVVRSLIDDRLIIESELEK